MANSRRSWTHSLLAVLVGVAVVAAACSSTGDENEVVGVVSQVSGDDSVTSFVVVDDAGVSHAFVPQEGLTCDGEPLEHLRTHLLERDRIAVTFDEGGDGPRTAIAITHIGD